MELKPCPFCGSAAELDRSTAIRKAKKTEVFRVECSGCHVRDNYWHTSYRAAARVWNTRAERTCHDANTRFNAWTCSECKCTQLLMFDDYGEPTLSVDGVASVPSYCPNCGAKVVEHG